MILNEGGNVFADAVPFDHKDVPAILKTINGTLQGTGITVIPVPCNAPLIVFRITGTSLWSNGVAFANTFPPSFNIILTPIYN